MSAFFVAPATIDAAVSAFIAKEGPLSLEAATELGRALWAMNAKAVCWRYGLDAVSDEHDQEHTGNLADAAAYAWTSRTLTLAVMVKSLDCLFYQCSEGPVCNLPLFKRLEALTCQYEETGVQETVAYRRAPWGLDDEAEPQSPEPADEPAQEPSQVAGQLALFG